MTKAQIIAKVMLNPPRGIKRKDWLDWLVKTITPLTMHEFTKAVKTGKCSVMEMIGVLNTVYAKTKKI